MENLLVIGASGLLGNKAVELGKEKYSVKGTFNSHSLNGNGFFPLNATKRHDVVKLIERLKPDFVIDTHSLTNVDYCETHQEEAWSVNVDGTKNIAEACKIFGSKLVFLSTDYVFDGKKTTKYTEKDKPKPLNYYAKTKLISERILEALDLDHLIIRTAVLYGKGGFGKLSFPLWVFEKLRKNEEIKVVLDQYNNPTFVDSLVEVLFSLCEKDARGTFHVVGQDCINRYEFAKMTADMFKLNKNLIKPTTTPEINQIARRPEKLNLSAEKAERITKVKAVGIREGLKALKEQLS